MTHRGNQRRAAFFNDRDRQRYLADLAVWANDAELSIELNPVRAGLVARAEEWPWSSAAAHAAGGSESGSPLLTPDRPFGGARPHPLNGRPIGWAEWLGVEGEAEAFIESIEARLGRIVGARRRGRKPKPREDENQLELFK